MKIKSGKLYYVGPYQAYATPPDIDDTESVKLAKGSIVMVLGNVGGKFKKCYWILTEDGKKYWLHETGFIGMIEGP